MQGELSLPLMESYDPWWDGFRLPPKGVWRRPKIVPECEGVDKEYPKDSVLPHKEVLRKGGATRTGRALTLYNVLQEMRQLKRLALNLTTPPSFYHEMDDYQDRVEKDRRHECFALAYKPQIRVEGEDNEYHPSYFLPELEHLDVVRVDPWFWCARIKEMNELRTLKIRDLEVSPMSGLIVSHMMSSLCLLKPHLSEFAFTVWGHEFAYSAQGRKATLIALSTRLPYVVLRPLWMP
jgi:hypothetical protein